MTKMKNIYSLLILCIFLTVSCDITVDEDTPADVPGIVSTKVGNQGGTVPSFDAIHADMFLDTVYVKDPSADFSNLFISAKLESGCRVDPLDGAPTMGHYGDYSTPQMYRVTAPSGNSADWTIVMEKYVEPIGCLADRWTGDLTCEDLIFGAPYHPTFCNGKKVDDDCSLLTVEFDLWGYGASTAVTFELQLEPIDTETLQGDLTLLKDAFVTAEGSDITFHAGPAGTYSASANELNIDVAWSGYDASASYTFKITPQE